MRRFATISFALACGPSLGDGTASEGGEDDGGSSGTAVDATSLDMTTSMAGDTGGDASSSSSVTNAESSTTEAMPDELPPDAAGSWLCTGFEDPLYLRLSIDDAM